MEVVRQEEETAGTERTARRPGALYLPLLRNRTFLLLWGGQTVSSVGDAVFNVAVIWVLYVRTGSALQTGVVSVLYTLTYVLLGPLAGAYADRWNRKWTMAGTAILSALFVGAAAVPIALGSFSPLLIYGTVLLVNIAGLFYTPARTSVLPEIVGRDRMAAAGGLFSFIDQGTSIIGAAAAGVILAALGAAWALISDAVSFLAIGLAIVAASIPGRSEGAAARQGASVFRDVLAGWQAIRRQPVLRSIVRLAALVNVIAYTGAIFPALVRLQMHGDARVYGALEAAGVVGGMVGAVAAGAVEARIGAGRLIVLSYAVAGACYALLGLSTSIPLSAVLLLVSTLFLIAANVSIGALTPLLIPQEYRGRVSSTIRACAVVAMPITTLLGGWATDLIGPGPLYVIAGLWIMGMGVLAWSDRYLRGARVAQVTAT